MSTPLQSTPELPMLDVLGIEKTHGHRAVRWLRNHCVLACYDHNTRTLRAPEMKYGADHTYKMMHKAIDATKRGG